MYTKRLRLKIQALIQSLKFPKTWSPEPLPYDELDELALALGLIFTSATTHPV